MSRRLRQHFRSIQWEGVPEASATRHTHTYGVSVSVQWSVFCIHFISSFGAGREGEWFVCVCVMCRVVVGEKHPQHPTEQQQQRQQLTDWAQNTACRFICHPSVCVCVIVLGERVVWKSKPANPGWCSGARSVHASVSAGSARNDDCTMSGYQQQGKRKGRGFEEHFCCTAGCKRFKVRFFIKWFFPFFWKFTARNKIQN